MASEQFLGSRVAPGLPSSSWAPEIEDLNALVKLRGKLRSARFSLSFLSLCLTNRAAPKFITAHIFKSGVKRSPTIKRASLQDEIQKTKTKILNLKRLYTRQWSKTRPFLTFFDSFRLCRYITEIDQRTQKTDYGKHDRNIGMLVRKRFGGLISDLKKHILNLSDYSLYETETFFLGNGLVFCTPPQRITREELFAEFEIYTPNLPGTVFLILWNLTNYKLDLAIWRTLTAALPSTTQFSFA